MAIVDPLNIINWVLDFNPEALNTPTHINTHKRKLAEKIFSSKRWQVTASGIVTGFFANPITGAPAAAIDFTATLKTHIITAAHIALIYDPDFFRRDEIQHAKWELLIPVLNLDERFFKNLNKHSSNVSHKAIASYLNQEKFTTFEKAILRYIAITIARRSALTKTVPIVSSIMGGGWNAFHFKKVEKRVIDYFENRDTPISRKNPMKGP